MRAVAVLLLLGLCAGCGGSAEAPKEPVYPVTGIVTFKGKPISGADVTFFNREKNRSAFGRTNEQGEFQLTTFSANDGAVEGQQIVTIAKIAAPVAPVVQADTESEAYEPPRIGSSTEPPPPKSDLPEKFGNQTTSGLVAMVSASDENKIDFALE